MFHRKMLGPKNLAKYYLVISTRSATVSGFSINNIIFLPIILHKIICYLMIFNDNLTAKGQEIKKKEPENPACKIQA